MVDLMFVATVSSMCVPIVIVLSKWQGKGIGQSYRTVKKIVIASVFNDDLFTNPFFKGF